MASEPATQEPIAQEVTKPEPAVKKPAKKKPAAKKPTVKKSVARKSSKKAASKKSAPKKKVAKKRVGKKKIATKKSVAKKAVAKKSAPKKPKAKKQPATPVVSKAQSIRDIANELGKKARPRDIIAALAEKGIEVASAQVSMTLKAAGLRKGRRRQVAGVASPKHSANGHGFSIEALLKVKKLADELGGTDKIKALMAALERLI